jgi:hypothetical protein
MLPCDPTSEMADQTGISLPTLWKWREQYAIKSNWRPGSMKTITKHILTNTQNNYPGPPMAFYDTTFAIHDRDDAMDSSQSPE